MASARSLSVRVRARGGGADDPNLKPKPNRPQTKGCARAANAALETKPNQPNPYNQW